MWGGKRGGDEYCCADFPCLPQSLLVRGSIGTLPTPDNDGRIFITKGGHRIVVGWIIFLTLRRSDKRKQTMLSTLHEHVPISNIFNDRKTCLEHKIHSDCPLYRHASYESTSNVAMTSIRITPLTRNQLETAPFLSYL